MPRSLFAPFRPSCHRANLRMGEYLSLNPKECLGEFKITQGKNYSVYRFLTITPGGGGSGGTTRVVQHTQEKKKGEKIIDGSTVSITLVWHGILKG